MMEPYQYSITWYPTKEQEEANGFPKILYHGMFIAKSQLDAYTKMIDIVTADEALEADQIEFMAKPFVEPTSCKTKKDIGNSFLYNFYLNDNVYELRTSTASLEDFIKGTFLNYDNGYKQPELPMAMLMIDVLGLLKDDNKL